MMALLGVALPELRGRQVALELYPAQTKKKSVRSVVSESFQDFVVVPLPPLDQRDLWEAFQRVINMCSAACWDINLRQELLDLSHDRITPPRNRFLYRASHWPLGDLISDVQPPDLAGFIGKELNPEDPGFLMRLTFVVYRLFEQLMSDLAEHSAVVRTQLEGSRCLVDNELPELGCYRDFVSQTGPHFEGAG
jgi:hypothetical protein